MIFFILFFTKCNVRTKVTKHSAALNFKSQIKLGNGERNVLTVGSHVPYAYFAMYTMQPEAKKPPTKIRIHNHAIQPTLANSTEKIQKQLCYD